MVGTFHVINHRCNGIFVKMFTKEPERTFFTNINERIFFEIPEIQYFAQSNIKV